MNNEPVAWMNTRISDDRVFLDWEKTKLQNYLSIPLYTHPVKEHFEDEPQAEELHEILQSSLELTDEEIADFLYAYCLDMGDVYEASEEQFIKCVRAILRKANEK